MNPWREDFPILSTRIRNKPLVYLDNAATTQKPRVVIDAIRNYYETTNANIHRGVHFLSEKATHDFEKARQTVRKFLNATSEAEIVFVRGATEGINLVAQSFGDKFVNEGDEVLVTEMEHHSNILPWQMLCKRKGAHLKVVSVNLTGDLDLESLERSLSPKTKIFAVTQISNALGTHNPLEKIIALAHSKGVPVLVDGAQGAAHLKQDVKKLDCDFYVFSGHKIYGPTGIGVLYGKKSWLEQMPPYQGGGDMIERVTFELSTYNVLPYKFEAGTPNIEGAIGLGAALQYLETNWMSPIGSLEDGEREVVNYAVARLQETPGVVLVGTPSSRVGVVAFMVEGVHPHDVGTILDREGIAIRAGHHCAQPLMERFGVMATCRASFSFYNTKEDVDHLIEGIKKVREVFHR